MKENTRTKFIKKLYKEEIKELIYEEYIDIDDIRKIRTYMLLNDAFNTIIKLENIGIWSEEKIKTLNNLGYISSTDERAKTLKKY